MRNSKKKVVAVMRENVGRVFIDLVADGHYQLGSLTVATASREPYAEHQRRKKREEESLRSLLLEMEKLLEMENASFPWGLLVWAMIWGFVLGGSLVWIIK